jgi:hypothetical protein
MFFLEFNLLKWCPIVVRITTLGERVRALKPKVVRLVEGVYHGDVSYPYTLEKPPKFVLRSSNASSRCCKWKMHQGEVFSMMDVSDTVFDAMPDELRATLMKVPKLAPLKVLVADALTVIKGMPGGGAYEPEGV